jgi:hypothetical protein
MIVGLTGKRGVGKSTAADVLEEYGFIRGHAFDGGKAATVGYFIHLGMSADMADEAVYGNLRDEPNWFLPHNEKPRLFMEKFGKWFGTVLGPDWTLGAELDRIERKYPGAPVVIESVIYEAALLRSRGGRIIRIIRPDYDGVVGLETDAAEREIYADREIINDGSIDDLADKIVKVAGELCASLETRS